MGKVSHPAVRTRSPVRGRPWKADGYADRFHGADFVRYASVDTATQRPTAPQGDTRWDTEETGPLVHIPVVC